MFYFTVITNNSVKGLNILLIFPCSRHIKSKIFRVVIKSRRRRQKYSIPSAPAGGRSPPRVRALNLPAFYNAARTRARKIEGATRGGGAKPRKIFDRVTPARVPPAQNRRFL